MSDNDSNRYFRLTRRMCEELREAFEGASYDGSDYAWENVKSKFDAGAESKSGVRIDLESMNERASEHLLRVMKYVESRTFHKQAGDALRQRINILNNHLGVSAVDRLGELM